MILTTLVYLKRNNQTLLLYRNKKEKGINEGKWIGVGGKLKPGESPYECAVRETYEETGYQIHRSMKRKLSIKMTILSAMKNIELFILSMLEYKKEVIKCMIS